MGLNQAGHPILTVRLSTAADNAQLSRVSDEPPRHITLHPGVIAAAAVTVVPATFIAAAAVPVVAVIVDTAVPDGVRLCSVAEREALYKRAKNMEARIKATAKLDSATGVKIEGFLTSPIFTIMLEDCLVGQIESPKHGMGVAKLTFCQGALDPFRANRMRALLVCATVLISDVYWGAFPNAFLLKAPLPFLR